MRTAAIRCAVLATALACCGQASGAEVTLSRAALELARRNGVHEAILAQARAKKLAGAALSDFYSAQAKAADEWFSLYKKTAEEAGRDSKAALQAWREKASASPADIDAWFFRAVAEERAGYLRDAMASYTKVMQLDRQGRWGMAYYLRALLHRDLDEPAAAAADLDSALSIAPGNAYFYGSRASLGVEQSNYAAAAKDLAKFFELCQDTGAAQAVSGGGDCEELTAMGFAIKGCAQAADTKSDAPQAAPAARSENFSPWEYESDNERLELAVYLYDALAAVRNIAKDGDGPERRARLFSMAGDTALVSLSEPQRSLRAALKLYDLSLLVQPSARAYVKRGTVYLELAHRYRHEQSLKLAQADFDRALALDSTGFNGWAYLLRASVKAVSSDEAGAAADIAQAIKADPKNACFLKGRAELLARQQNYSQAAQDLKVFLSTLDAKLAAPEINPLCTNLAEHGFALEECKTGIADMGSRVLRQTNPLPLCSPPLELVGEP